MDDQSSTFNPRHAFYPFLASSMIFSLTEGVRRCQFAAWFKSGLQLRVAGGRRPQGEAPRFEASALGLAGQGQLDPSHPAGVEVANHVFGVPESG